MTEKTVSLAQRVRDSARSLGGQRESFSASDLFDAVGVRTYREKKRAYNTVRDLVLAGEFERVAPGLYRCSTRRKKPQMREIMWRYLRMSRTVTVEDLMQVAECSESYAREWLGILIKRRVVRDHGNGNYQIVKDALEPPRDDEKAERLRELRARKRAAMIGAVKSVHESVCDLCGRLEELVEAMSEEVDEDVFPKEQTGGGSCDS